MVVNPQQTHVLHQWKHGPPLIACTFDPAGAFVVTSSEDYTLQRWSLADGERTVWAAHESWVLDLAFLPDGETLVTAGCDDSIVLWEARAAQPTPRCQIAAHNGWVRALACSPDGTLIASGGNDRLVKLWSVDGRAVQVLSGHDSHVYSLLFHPSGEWLLSGDLSGRIHQWEVASGRLLRTFEAPELHTHHRGQNVHYGGIRGLALSPDGQILSGCGLHNATNPLGAVNDPLMILFNWESGEKLRLQPAADIQGIAWDIIFLDEHTELAVSGGSGGGYLLFWKVSEEQPFHKFKLPDTARSLALHPTAPLVATTHFDGHVRLCRLTADESR